MQLETVAASIISVIVTLLLPFILRWLGGKLTSINAHLVRINGTIARQQRYIDILNGKVFGGTPKLGDKPED